LLVGAMNPCPCGYYGDPVKECACALTNVLRYQKRISGPLLDHIDIHCKRRARLSSHLETCADDCGFGGLR